MGPRFCIGDRDRLLDPPAPGRAIKIQGNVSVVGKSRPVTGLTRACLQRGSSAATFQSQNMSRTAAVMDDGGKSGCIRRSCLPGLFRAYAFRAACLAVLGVTSRQRNLSGERTLDARTDASGGTFRR